MPTVEDYIEQIRDLAIIPPVLVSVLSLPDDTDLSFGKLENMVQSDQVLVARMLKLANSPFYSRGNRVTGIRQVITRLGFRTVRSMVAIALADSIFMHGNYRKFKDEVWTHSIATGVLAHYLAHEYKMKEYEDFALVAGLLLDLGKVVLNSLDRKKYIEVLTEFLEEGQTKPIEEIEEKHFGVRSEIIAVEAAKLWQLPPSVIEILEERPQKIEEQKDLSKLLNLADLLVRKLGFGKHQAHHESELEQYAEFYGIKLSEEYLEGKKKQIEGDGLYQFCLSL
ncbi:MAG: histidine kinase [Leptospiraceae bacterium]|nr:histidine kinase [Leptospiraceae bacterium]